MDEELLKSLLLKAKDQYESANRWSYIIILVCLLFHLMTFSQYVYVVKKQSEAKATGDRLKRIDTIAAEIKSNLENLNGLIKKPLKTRTEKLIGDLKNDFKALNRSIAQITTPATRQFTSSSADFLLERDNQAATMQMQMPVSQRKPEKREFELDNTLKEKIRAANSPEFLRDLLLPVIEEQIINKRFDDLNDYWQEKSLVSIKKETEKIRKIIQKNKLLLSDDSFLWDQIVKSVEQVEQISKTLKFLPPKDPYWWATVTGKVTSLAGIRETALNEFDNAIQRSNIIDGLRKKMRDALAKQRELQASLNKSLKKIQDDFEIFKAKLSSLNKTFGIISLDLNYVVPMFPLFSCHAYKSTWLAAEPAFPW